MPPRASSLSTAGAIDELLFRVIGARKAELAKLIL
jgi:hypothetical protein